MKGGSIIGIIGAVAAQGLGHGEGDQVVGDRQQEGLLPIEPLPRVVGPAGRTMPVAAGVEGEALLSAAWAQPVLPPKWKHATDELYARLRGPATNLTVLATAFADPAQRGTSKNEPILMAIDCGKGRVFHTVIGHGPEAMSGLGFQVTLARGSEWAATGKVTLAPPAAGALSADKAAKRTPALRLRSGSSLRKASTAGH
jgi:hypothetical protein